MFGASSLIVTMAAMAGGSILVSFLLVNLHGARSPMRPKNVVLLEIMIIFISFKDADLLHYLLPDVFTRWRRVWGTMEAVARPQPPHRGLLVSFFLIFPPFSIVFVWARQKLRLVSIFAAGSMASPRLCLYCVYYRLVAGVTVENLILIPSQSALCL